MASKHSPPHCSLLVLLADAFSVNTHSLLSLNRNLEALVLLVQIPKGTYHPNTSTYGYQGMVLIPGMFMDAVKIFAGAPLPLTGGVAALRLKEARKGFAGSTVGSGRETAVKEDVLVGARRADGETGAQAEGELVMVVLGHCGLLEGGGQGLDELEEGPY